MEGGGDGEFLKLFDLDGQVKTLANTGKFIPMSSKELIGRYSLGQHSYRLFSLRLFLVSLESPVNCNSYEHGRLSEPQRRAGRLRMAPD